MLFVFSNCFEVFNGLWGPGYFEVHLLIRRSTSCWVTTPSFLDSFSPSRDLFKAVQMRLNVFNRAVVRHCCNTPGRTD